MHSKLTAFPIAAYLLAVGLDAVSIIGGDDRTWSRELWHVGTYLFVAGAVVSVLAALDEYVGCVEVVGSRNAGQALDEHRRDDHDRRHRARSGRGRLEAVPATTPNPRHRLRS